MDRMKSLITLTGLLTCLWGCGDDCQGLCGSQCDNMDCSYDHIKCQLSEGEGIKILYERADGTVLDYAAIVYCDIAGVDKVAGSRFEGDEFLQRCKIERPPHGEAWPEFTGNFCEFTKGGDQAGQAMSGKCSFAFVNGYFATASFSCTLQAIER